MLAGGCDILCNIIHSLPLTAGHYTQNPCSAYFECNGDISVRREKALVHSGRQTRPGTGSLHPVTIGAAVEVTKPSEPPV